MGAQKEILILLKKYVTMLPTRIEQWAIAFALNRNFIVPLLILVPCAIIQATMMMMRHGPDGNMWPLSLYIVLHFYVIYAFFFRIISLNRAFSIVYLVTTHMVLAALEIGWPYLRLLSPLDAEAIYPHRAGLGFFQALLHGDWLQIKLLLLFLAGHFARVLVSLIRFGARN